MSSGQRQPFEMAVADQGMEVVFDLTGDGRGIDMETEFYVPHLRGLGEVSGRDQSFTPSITTHLACRALRLDPTGARDLGS